MLEIKLVNSYKDFVELREKWNKLLEESDNSTVFLTWEWMKTWWQVFGREYQLALLLGYSKEGALVGIAPLMKRVTFKSGIPVRCLQFISSDDHAVPEYLNFIIARGCEREYLDALYRYLLYDASSWDVINLKDMKDDPDIIASILRLVNERYSCLVRKGGQCCYVELPRSWEEYLGLLSRKSRYNIGKKERDLAKDYSIEFSIVTSEKQLDQVMLTLSELHKKRMYAKNMTGLSLKPEFWRFQTMIAREFLYKGWLVLGVLKANNNIVACQYAYQYNKILFHYQSGIDPEYSKYSVGLISNAYMIREAIHRGLEQYDFLRGHEEYKLHWAKGIKNNVEISVWNKTFQAAAARAAYCVRQAMCKVVKYSGNYFK